MIVFTILGLVFCYRTHAEVQEVTYDKNRQIRLNPTYYHDENAFTLIYNRLLGE